MDLRVAICGFSILKQQKDKYDIREHYVYKTWKSFTHFYIKNI